MIRTLIPGTADAPYYQEVEPGLEPKWGRVIPIMQLTDPELDALLDDLIAWQKHLNAEMVSVMTAVSFRRRENADAAMIQEQKLADELLAAIDACRSLDIPSVS